MSRYEADLAGILYFKLSGRDTIINKITKYYLMKGHNLYSGEWNSRIGLAYFRFSWEAVVWSLTTNKEQVGNKRMSIFGIHMKRSNNYNDLYSCLATYWLCFYYVTGNQCMLHTVKSISHFLLYWRKYYAMKHSFTSLFSNILCKTF